MSVKVDCQVDFAKLLLRQPFTGREASDGFEDTIEGRVVGKTRFQTYLRHFLFRMVAEQLLGVSHAVAVDKLGERPSGGIAYYLGCRSAYSWETSGMQGQSFWGFRS